VPTRRLNLVAAAFHQFRTEGLTPVRQAYAVAAGFFIGCTPFIGFHLTLCLLVGRLFRLNRLLMYAAANISNPFVAPFLYAAEIQIGSWIRTGTLYSPATLEQIRLGGLAIDILIGSAVVGSILAAAGGWITYALVRAPRGEAAVARLIEAASARYLAVGLGAWEFARNKLRHDPVYLALLRDGALPSEGRLVDLGCGHGLTLSLLIAAREQYAAGDWPAGWPAPPANLDLAGLELRPRAVRRGREALGSAATIEERDLSGGGLPPARAFVIFDVLHLMPREAQERLLSACAGALEPGGVLVVREADAAGGWRFQVIRITNRIVGALHGKPFRTFCFRTRDEWRAALAARGFDVREAPAPTSGLLANFTLYATAPPRTNRTDTSSRAGA
jgi:uncharacterized protein (DUF2062 family)